MNKLTTQTRYIKARRHLDDESFDACGPAGVHTAPLTDANTPHPEFARQRTLREGTGIIGGGVILKTIPGMGTIYDWRNSPWTPANGGKIKPLIFVQHIPVVPNLADIADFVRLRDVLVAQGLMVQNATDRDGNVAMYTPMDQLCYQAMGANQVSCGTEHMHLTIGETWTKRQLRASAWLVNQAELKHGIPLTRGTLGTGNRVVRVLKGGQVSHAEVSAHAFGVPGRSDPGPGYDFEYVRHCVGVWRARIADGTADTKGFEGA